MQEQLVLDASRELYDNSESGNLHRGSMKLAYEWSVLRSVAVCMSSLSASLAVAPPTPRVRKEREFIEATSRLASFRLESEPGVPLSPIQIRLTPPIRIRMLCSSWFRSSATEATKRPRSESSP
jgi:hypothetical protein